MRKLFTILAVILVLVLIGAGIMQWQRGSTTDPLPPLGGPGGGQAPVQPEHCVDVQVIAAPGTWESAPDDDPHNPTANPWSFMLSVTQPLQERFNPAEVEVWTLPYTAQFRNVNAQHEMSYDDSRNEGTATLEAELADTHAECPLTDFVIAGFSQGAVIAGDLASRIGNGRGVVPAERIRGVALVADGRREPGVGQVPGTQVNGVGAEITLQSLNFLIQAVVPGATMRGPREGGFGELDDRTFDICAPNDSICDAPRDAGNAIGRAQALVEANGIHAMYATNPDVIPGSTTNQWLVDWATGLVEQ